MKTSTAIANSYKCPICKDDLTEDKNKRGFVRHKNNRECKHGNGEKDC